MLELSSTQTSSHKGMALPLGLVAASFMLFAGGNLAGNGVVDPTPYWSALPGWRWLARVTGLPLIRPLTDRLYRGIAAPLLYRAHLRRERRKSEARAS